MRNCSFRRKTDVAGAESGRPVFSSEARRGASVIVIGRLAIVVTAGGVARALATSVASCRDDLASDCIDGMFAQHGMAAINLAPAAGEVVQQMPAQAGSDDARNTTMANAIVAARLRVLSEFAAGNVTGCFNLARTLPISRSGKALGNAQAGVTTIT